MSLVAVNLALITALVVGVEAWRRHRASLRFRVRARIARAPIASVAAVSVGARAGVRGVVASRETLTAPLTGRRCVAYVVEVAHKPRINRPWVVLGREVHGLRFEVRDGTGALRVDPQGGALGVRLRDAGWSGFLDAPTAVERDLLLRLGALGEDGDPPRDAVYREGIVAVGDDVEVLGWCTADGLSAPEGQGFRDGAAPRRVLVSTIDAPLLIAHTG